MEGESETARIIAGAIEYTVHLDSSTNADLFWESFEEGWDDNLFLLYLELATRAESCKDIGEWDALHEARINVFCRLSGESNPFEDMPRQQG